MTQHQLSAAAFADKINVQRSTISHLLSGRNKPSLDFVLKVLDVFKDVDLYWLLNGKGDFPKTDDGPTLPASGPKQKTITLGKSKGNENIDRIIIFYKDGSFKSYESVT